MSASATEASRVAQEHIWAATETDSATVLVDSPPGAGKSTLVREISRRQSRRNQVPIVVQTNDQADDMVRGLIRESAQHAPELRIGRLHGSTYQPPADIGAAGAVTSSNQIVNLRHCDIVIAPAAKWATLDGDDVWPLGIIDEAYQMRSDMLLPVGSMMARLLLVGDPGQLAPFTPADDTRFRGRPLSPVETAAATILTTHPDTIRIPLAVSWRLPPQTASIISDAFYRDAFTSGTELGTRRIVPRRGRHEPSAVVRQAVRTGWAYVELDDVIVPNNDQDAIDTLVRLLRDVLSAQISVHDERGARPLRPNDVAIGVTHRDQRDYVRAAAGDVLNELGFPNDAVTVDTANVLQGREFEIVLVWHPLSGRRDASSFHLDAGRLCVLLSRHRQACIVVARAGIREQLRTYPSTDPVWLGETAPVTDGWYAHAKVLEHLESHRA